MNNVLSMNIIVHVAIFIYLLYCKYILFSLVALHTLLINLIIYIII